MARRVRSFQRGPRRPTDWGASAPQSAALNIPASSAVLLETFIPIAGGETVIRTRGQFGIASDQKGADEDQFGAFGIAIVTQQAVSVGITAIPHPVTDAAWGGWMVHRYFSQQFVFVSAVGFHPQFMMEYVIDSKAMRKLDEDERLVVVVENIGAEGFNIQNSERILTKVH